MYIVPRKTACNQGTVPGVRAETIACDDYIKYGGEQGAKDAGKMRLEGKEYVVRDGDVFLFRFNV